MATTPVIKMTPPWTPELLPEVQRTIESFLIGKHEVLELGSGWSTLWFAAMPGVYVRSIEHSREWRDEVDKAAVAAGLAHSMFLTWEPEPSEFVQTIQDLEGPLYHDLILIDCVDEARLPSLIYCINRITNDGWIVVDDSHWEMFNEIPGLMHKLGFNSMRFSGQHTRKTGEVKFHQTSIYFKSRGVPNV